MSDLTPRQGETLLRIHEYHEAHSMPPTIRDISEQMGCVSRNGCDFSFKQLARKGYLTSRAGAVRSHLLTDAGRQWVADHRAATATSDE